MPSLPDQLLRAFVAREKTLALAESCTGGLLASLLTGPSGASAYVKGGVVSYADEVKVGLLGVDARTLQDKGAVSAEVAKMMATGAREKMKGDIGVSITGFAGPTGADVGLVYIGVATARGVEAHQWRFAPPRDNVRREAADEAMRLALAALDR